MRMTWLPAQLAEISTLIMAMPLACGGIVATPTEQVAVDAGEAGIGIDPPPVPGVEPGCPDAMPKNEQPCAAGPYYCHYYTTGDRCPIEWKCTSKGGPPFGFYGGDRNCYEKFSPDTCNDGLSCSDAQVEPNGGCVVACARRCRCEDPTADKLVCRKIAC